MARARESLDLGWSASFPTGPSRTVVARLMLDDATGWAFEEAGTDWPWAWLYRYERETWVSLGVTRDEFWTFAPDGRHRPDLVASDRHGRPAAICRRPFRRSQRLELAGVELRLRPPLDPIRLVWRLSDADGLLARIDPVKGRPGLTGFRFRWERTCPSPALVSLLVAYSLAIEYGTQMHLSGAGS